MSYVLFYSSNCKFCYKLFYIIEKYNISHLFIKKNIDINKNTGKRPEFVKQYKLTEIPALLVNNKILVGKNVFIFIKNIINEMKNGSMHSTSTRDQKIDMRQFKEPTENNVYNAVNDSSLLYNESNFMSLDDPVYNGTSVQIEQFSNVPSRTNENIHNGVAFDNNVGNRSNVSNGKLPCINTQNDNEDEKKKVDRDYARLLKERELMDTHLKR